MIGKLVWTLSTDKEPLPATVILASHADWPMPRVAMSLLTETPEGVKRFYVEGVRTGDASEDIGELPRPHHWAYIPARSEPEGLTNWIFYEGLAARMDGYTVISQDVINQRPLIFGPKGNQMFAQFSGYLPAVVALNETIPFGDRLWNS